MRTPCLLLLVSLAWLPCALADEPQLATVAFVHVNLVPMDVERTVPDQTVIIRNGRIAAIGPADHIGLPADAVQIDGSDRYLVPGLADMHVHTWDDDELVLFVAYGVTTVRNMFGGRVHLSWRERIAAGEMFGPTLYTAGPILDGQPPYWPGSKVVKSARGAGRAVRQQKRAGYDFLKIYNGLSREAYDGIVAAAQEEGLSFAGHVPNDVGLEHVLASGQACIEHLDGYALALRADDAPIDESLTGFAAGVPAWAHMDETKLPAMVEATRRAGVWNCPTLVVYQAYGALPEAEKMLAREEMKYVLPATRKRWRGMRDTATPAQGGAAGHEARLKLVKALHDAGARLILGTDCLNPFVVHGHSVHQELQNFVDAGLTPYQAMCAATRDAAEFMNVQDEWGTVAVGLRADLLLVEANPFEDVGHLRRRVGVMLRGHWYPQSELRAMLEGLAEKYARAETSASRSGRDASSHGK